LIRKLLQGYIETESWNREWKKAVTGGRLREAFEGCDKDGKGFFDIENVLLVFYFR
jgi:hypothetical protein